MKILVLYRHNSDHRQIVEEFLRELNQQHPESKIETLDVDSREGIAVASLYDITQDIPRIMALNNEGMMLQGWQGIAELPRISDIAYYAVDNL